MYAHNHAHTSPTAEPSCTAVPISRWSKMGPGQLQGGEQRAVGKGSVGPRACRTVCTGRAAKPNRCAYTKTYVHTQLHAHARIHQHACPCLGLRRPRSSWSRRVRVRFRGHSSRTHRAPPFCSPACRRCCGPWLRTCVSTASPIHACAWSRWPKGISSSCHGLRMNLSWSTSLGTRSTPRSEPWMS